MFFKREHYVQNVERARKFGLTYQPRTGKDRVEDLPRQMDKGEMIEAGVEPLAWIWAGIDKSALFIPIKPPPAEEEIMIRDLPGDVEIETACLLGIWVCLCILAYLRMPW